MLNAETPFPNVGSYALTVDPVTGLDAGQVELVRILEAPPGGLVLVSFPLRDNAGGTKRIAPSELIDGTPLTGAEGREMIDLERELRQRGPVGKDGRATKARVRGRAAKQLRHDALRQRAIWAPHLRLLLVEAARREARRRAA